MLIKPFIKQKEDIDDIDNITQKSRYMFIYRYSQPHSCSYSSIFGVFNDYRNYYDVYLINDSQVNGIGFYVDKGVVLKNRNSYRGFCQNALLPDGKLNYDATVKFVSGTYLNRIEPKLRRDDPIAITSFDALLASGGPGGDCFDAEINASLGTDIIQPYPQFYNVEDQAWLGNKYGSSLKIGDFLYDYDGCPVYTLRDLIDKYTNIAIIDIPSNGNILSQALTPYAIDPSVTLNTGKKADLEALKSTITTIFINLFMTVSRSVFSVVDIIIDLETGQFSVNPLNCKFNNVSKDDMIRDKVRIAYDVSNKIDDIVEMTEDVPDELYINNLCPNRLTIHISNFNSAIKLSNIYQNTIVMGKDGKPKKDCLNASGLLSTSDSDDLVQVFATGIGG